MHSIGTSRPLIYKKGTNQYVNINLLNRFIDEVQGRPFQKNRMAMVKAWSGLNTYTYPTLLRGMYLSTNFSMQRGRSVFSVLFRIDCGSIQADGTDKRFLQDEQ